MWRVFDAEDTISGNFRRQADYEVCGFLFFWAAALIAVLKLKGDGDAAVARAIALGALVYITVYGVYTNFTNLNNLRIVDQSNDKMYYWPLTNAGPIDRVQQRKFFGGLILGYFSLILGLLSMVSGCGAGKAGGFSVILFFIGTVIAIPGIVVCWSSSGAPTYPNFAVASASAATVQLAIENALFHITTFVVVQWFVLLLGLFSDAKDLVSGSGWIFGLGNLFAPVAYFFIQSQSPDDSKFTWAGPILCWIGCAVLALAALVSPGAGAEPKKEAAV